MRIGRPWRSLRWWERRGQSFSRLSSGYNEYEMATSETPNGNLPWRASDRKCNARLLWGAGYCENGAGEGTNHTGDGRCALHGGEVKQNVDVKELISEHGLASLVDIAETMDWNDAEYIYHVTNSALTVQRAKIVTRIGHPDVSPKELADLTMALKRIDDLLGKYKRELLTNQETGRKQDNDAAERDRLNKLAEKYGT